MNYESQLYGISWAKFGGHPPGSVLQQAMYCLKVGN